VAELDDGFSRVANELLEEAAKRKFNSTQSSIVFFVLRHTYGFQRKSHEMSVGFISEGIGANSDQIKRELKRLIDWKVIRVFEEATFTTPRVIGMNKDCEEWLAPKHGGLLDTEGTEQSPPDEIDAGVGAIQPSPPGDYLAPQIKIGFKDNFKDSIYTVFEHWNSKKIIVHRELTQAIRSAINARLKSYSIEKLLDAIDNYHLVLVGDEFYWTYKWPIKTFMNPNNVDRFISENDPFTNYRRKGNNRGAFDSDAYLNGLED